MSIDWNIPLAERMRPSRLEEVVGQDHLLGENKPLYRLLSGSNGNGGHLHSMVFWGPPGTGKTTLARLIANTVQAEFISLSAVTSGIQDIRKAVGQAMQIKSQMGKTLLFVDEVHRFNKTQQDAFLPHIEDGTIVFVGATTENPSFELNNALLSRARVYLLKPLETAHIESVIHRAIKDNERGLGQLNLEIETAALEQLCYASQGDVRRGLGFLETAADLAAHDEQADGQINIGHIEQVLSERIVRYDKGGDHFYDQISALHKSVRGSNPDAAIYWACRMLRGGCDPHYLLRRLVVIASEDIGNADPRALPLAMSAWDAFDRLGSPEGEQALFHAVCYLSVAAKSNAVYLARKRADQTVSEYPDEPVPNHLRNAPTKLSKQMGHGKDYRYAHDEPHSYSPGQTYLPEKLIGQRYYYPTENGLEKKIAEKLEWLKKLDEEGRKQ